MTLNKKVLEDKRNQFLERKLKQLKKLFLDQNVQFAKEKVYIELKDVKLLFLVEQEK